MIRARDVDTVLFDVLCTVVDEAGSIRAELAADSRTDAAAADLGDRLRKSSGWILAGAG